MQRLRGFDGAFGQTKEAIAGCTQLEQLADEFLLDRYAGQAEACVRVLLRLISDRRGPVVHAAAFDALASICYAQPWRAMG